MPLHRSALLLAFSLAAPAAAQHVPPEVAVRVWSFGFAPRAIHLRAGQPVTLTFINSSRIGHDFTAIEFFASSTIVAGAAPGGEIELAGHQARRITLVPRPGAYRAHCSHFLHAQMGMTDTILVD
jgi:plastocyanin